MEFCKACGEHIKLPGLGCIRRGMTICVDCRQLPEATALAMSRLLKNAASLAWKPIAPNPEDEG